MKQALAFLTMIAPECPKMFDKSRTFLGEQLGASRTTEIYENACTTGIERHNVAASSAATHKPLLSLDWLIKSFSFPCPHLLRPIL